MIAGVNLMSEVAQRKALIRRHATVWVIGLPLLALALIAPASLRWQHSRLTANERAALEAQYEPAFKTKREVAVLRRKLADLTKDEGPALALANFRSSAGLMTVVGEAAASSGLRLRLEELSVVDRGPLNDSPQHGVVQLKGLSVGSSDVARLVQALRHDPFVEVELASSQQVEAFGHRLETFTIQCSY